MTRNIYTDITNDFSHDHLFKLFLGLAKQPFVEKRLPAQYYFKAMTQTKWGLTKLFEPNKFNSEDEFLDGYLINRAIELEKEGLESIAIRSDSDRPESLSQPKTD